MTRTIVYPSLTQQTPTITVEIVDLFVNKLLTQTTPVSRQKFMLMRHRRGRRLPSRRAPKTRCAGWQQRDHLQGDAFAGGHESANGKLSWFVRLRNAVDEKHIIFLERRRYRKTSHHHRR